MGTHYGSRMAHSCRWVKESTIPGTRQLIRCAVHESVNDHFYGGVRDEGRAACGFWHGTQLTKEKELSTCKRLDFSEMEYMYVSGIFSTDHSNGPAS